jgi:hypothetical protein
LVQTAVPLQTCQAAPDSEQCLYCAADLTGARVFSSGGDEEDDAPESPFAKLAQFRDKK